MSFLGHFGSYLGHFGPFWVIFVSFWITLGSFLGHPVVLPVKTTGRSSSQKHIKLTAARWQHGRQAGRQARRQARRQAEKQVPQAHCAGKGVCTGIILAIYGTLAIRGHMPISPPFSSRVSMILSVGPFHIIQWMTFTTITIILFFSTSSSSSVIVKVWLFYFKRRKYA